MPFTSASVLARCSVNSNTSSATLRFGQARTELLEFDYLCVQMEPDAPIGKRSKEVFVERSSFLSGN
jgi:hypothetical protein